jgi:dTDP-4-amino-4,6-dideoxygalactose transaminase
MNDFKAESNSLKQSMLAAMARVANSGYFILGPELVEFEKQWAKACGVSYGVGVANGLDAIEIGLRCLKIGPGDEVITTPMTAFATILAILKAGATPVLADINLDSALLSLQSVERCLTNKTKAVVLVHLYGQLRDMPRWVEFCSQHKISLIEDCAQAHLAKWGEKIAGGFGTFGAYSFYPTKNLGAFGDAGMLVTSNLHISQQAARLRNYGQSIRYHHPEVGMNSRLDELQAAILLARLEFLDQYTNRRRQIAGEFRSNISNTAVRLLAPPQQADAHVNHLFVVNVDHRDRLQQHLLNHGVQSLIHYPIPIHHQEPCVNVRRDSQGLSNSELHAKTCLSIPCHPQMTDQDVQQVISAVNCF